MIIQIDPSIVVYEKRFQGICRKPYGRNKQGCPNFGKKEGCPPQPLLDKVFDLGQELFLIYTSFPVGQYAEKMRLEHEKLKTPSQWYNSRYWQPVARKEHNAELERLVLEHPEVVIDRCPEAHGVNVTDLMSKVGVELWWGEWPPDHSNHKEQMTYIVSMGGHRTK